MVVAMVVAMVVHGKCFSFCFGHYFSQDVIVVHPLALVIYVIQKTLMGSQVWNIFMFYVLSPMWIKKKSLANSQMGNIILLCHLYELKKNHLWANKCACHFLSYFAWVKKACKCARSFLFFSCVSRKNHLWACKCTISFFLHLCE